MRSKILTGAAALAFIITAVLVTAGPAPAQNWQGNAGNVTWGAAGPPAGFVGGPLVPLPGYNYAPLYGYYGAYDAGPWSYRGGPHPR
jgi:hypothetical protein